MRILIVNTSERNGGAAVAAARLVAALNNSGVQARMLVRDKQTTNPVVAALPKVCAMVGVSFGRDGQSFGIYTSSAATFLPSTWPIRELTSPRYPNLSRPTLSTCRGLTKGCSRSTTSEKS